MFAVSSLAPLPRCPCAGVYGHGGLHYKVRELGSRPAADRRHCLSGRCAFIQRTQAKVYFRMSVNENAGMCFFLAALVCFQPG